MADNNNEPDVKIIERVEIAPAGEGETVESPESSQEEETEEGAEEAQAESEETEESEEEESAEETEESEPPVPQNAAAKAPKTDERDQEGRLKRMPDESDSNWGQRLEIDRLRRELRGKRSDEILTPPPAAAKKELTPERKAILDKIKPEDMKAFRDVLDVAAEEMGFVRRDQLDASTFQKEATSVMDDFLEKHPEYLPQNDPEGHLWNQFKQEYGVYRPPASSKDLKKILEKVHKEVFRIQPAAALNKQDAAKEKVKVASHSGSSRPAPSREGVKRTAAPQGLRTDMLKGFSEEEIAEFTG